MKIDAQFVLSVVGSHNLVVDKKPQIAFIGRSNVGKSSVINCLVGQKSLVRSSSTPGKTQEINFFDINDERYFVDLPGYGYAKLGQKYREKLRKLILWYFISGEAPVTLAVLIVDAKAGMRDFDREMIDVLRSHGHNYIIVANKTDKLNQSELHASLENIRAEIDEGVPVVPFSATKGKGKKELLEIVMSVRNSKTRNS